MKLDHKIKADFIIIGGGTAGSTLANRLSTKYKVVVIEAGEDKDKDPLIVNSTDAMDLHEGHHNEFFWGSGETVPQENVNNRTFDYTGGRLLGGSSSINGMQYVRGSTNTYHKIERLVKDPDWSVKNVINTFKDFEKYNGKTNNKSARGYEGPIDIRQAPKKPTTMAEKFVNGVIKTTGYKPIIDYNDPNTPLGPFTQWQLYQHNDGTRVSGSIGYLDPITKIDKENNVMYGNDNHQLLVLLKATGLKIIFKDTDKTPRASGVHCLHNGVFRKIKAKNKVILTAGVFSPIILMQSGIGPFDDLKKLNIPIIFNNPNVGKNLYNHTLLMLTASANPNDIGLPKNDQDALYVGGAFLPDPTINNEKRGIQLIGMSSSSDTFNIIGIPVQPKSVGYVTLLSSDPLHLGQYDFKYLSDPKDMVTLKGMIRLINKIINNMGDPKYKLISPDPSILKNDEALEEFIKDNLDQNHHWVGTCKMAPLSQGGVVDSNGSVYGVKDLIVADASIFPYPNDGNTSACAFLAANIIANKLLR